MGSLRLILSVSLIVIHLDGLLGNITSLSKRNKRQCQNPFDCEITPSSTQLPFIPGRSNCVLPEYPDNGKWTIFDAPRKFPGEIVKAKTILHYKCDPKYKLHPESSQFSICYKFWSASPICLRTCPSVNSTQMMHVSCEIDNTVASCIDPYEGSKARFTCAPSHDDPNLRARPYLNCVGGSWDAPIPECKPENESKCRFRIPNLHDESVTPAILGEFPFMAVVGFRRDSNIFFLCSGALISTNYVITTAYCANIRGVGTPEVIRVGTFNHNANEPTAQDSKIAEIKIHPEYDPPPRYNNIALIKIETPFTLNSYVQPISIIASEGTAKRGIILNWIWQHMDTYYLNATLVRTTGAMISVDKCTTDDKYAYYPWYEAVNKGVQESTQLCMARPRLLRATASNGIFVTEDKQKPCTFRLVAISSIGMYLHDKYPEVYQKLYPYLGWINGIIGSDASKN